MATPSRLLPWGALIGKDITGSSLKHHLAFARANGVTQTEMAELLTRISLNVVPARTWTLLSSISAMNSRSAALAWV